MLKRVCTATRGTHRRLRNVVELMHPDDAVAPSGDRLPMEWKTNFRPSANATIVDPVGAMQPCLAPMTCPSCVSADPVVWVELAGSQTFPSLDTMRRAKVIGIMDCDTDKPGVESNNPKTPVRGFVDESSLGARHWDRIVNMVKQEGWTIVLSTSLLTSAKLSTLRAFVESDLGVQWDAFIERPIYRMDGEDMKSQVLAGPRAFVSGDVKTPINTRGLMDAKDTLLAEAAVSRNGSQATLALDYLSNSVSMASTSSAVPLGDSEDTLREVVLAYLANSKGHTPMTDTSSRDAWLGVMDTVRRLAAVERFVCHPNPSRRAPCADCGCVCAALNGELREASGIQDALLFWSCDACVPDAEKHYMDATRRTFNESRDPWTLAVSATGPPRAVPMGASLFSPPLPNMYPAVFGDDTPQALDVCTITGTLFRPPPPSGAAVIGAARFGSLECTQHCYSRAAVLERLPSFAAVDGCIACAISDIIGDDGKRTSLCFGCHAPVQGHDGVFRYACACPHHSWKKVLCDSCALARNSICSHDGCDNVVDVDCGGTRGVCGVHVRAPKFVFVPPDSGERTNMHVEASIASHLSTRYIALCGHIVHGVPADSTELIASCVAGSVTNPVLCPYGPNTFSHTRTPILSGKAPTHIFISCVSEARVAPPLAVADVVASISRIFSLPAFATVRVGDVTVLPDAKFCRVPLTARVSVVDGDAVAAIRRLNGVGFRVTPKIHVTSLDPHFRFLVSDTRLTHLFSDPEAYPVVGDGDGDGLGPEPLPGMFLPIGGSP